jgi:hypothetical protein
MLITFSVVFTEGLLSIQNLDGISSGDVLFESDDFESVSLLCFVKRP